MGYKTLEEWEKDLNVFRNNPEDMKFLQSIVVRVNNSDAGLKVRIQSALQEAVKWNDPVQSFNEITKDLSRTDAQALFINSKEDPWFEV